MAVNSDRGSEWHQWDLHVHTPCSIMQNYGGDSEEVWERFIGDLEALPDAFKVIGINDYMFTDGYRKILQYRDAGRLENIDLILPVFELRLKAFAGTEGRLRRINLHVLFSEEVTADLIDAQFLNALCPHYQLAPQYSSLETEWQMAPTRESLEQLGQLVLKSIPDEIRPPTRDLLQVGFNAVNFGVEDVREVLERPHFRDRHVLGIGKTEWWDLKWNEQSVAEKKDLINKCSLVFTAAENAEAWRRSQIALRKNGVEDRLLDCSDAHDFSDSDEKDRIGNCLTWIKADRTFAGLKHSLMEYAERVFIGDIPPQLRAVREAPSRYLNSIKLEKAPGAQSTESWFDQEIPLNSGLIAVIGNRGSGKSAFVESLSLAANTHRTEFSFLSKERFRRGGGGKAGDFVAEIEWMSGAPSRRVLSDDCDRNQPERVQFIPQRFLETVCNELPGGEEQDFDRELKRVIFSHLSEAETLGQDHLDALLRHVSEAAQEELVEKRDRLTEINTRLVELRGKADQDFQAALRAERDQLRQKLRDLRRAEPTPVPPPDEVEDSEATTTELAELRAANDEAEAVVAELRSQEKSLAQQAQNLETLKAKLGALEEQVRRFNEDADNLLAGLDLSPADLVKFEIHRAPLEALADEVDEQASRVKEQLDEDNDEGALGQIKQRAERIKQLQQELSEPARRHQQYFDEYDKWMDLRQEIIGTSTTPDTLLFQNRRIRELQAVPEKLATLRRERSEVAKSIAELLLGLCERYRKMYEPVQRIITDHEIGSKLGLAFDVGLVESGLNRGLFASIDRRVAGSFSGKADGDQRLHHLIERTDLEDSDAILSLAESILKHLDFDFHDEPPTPSDISAQLRQGTELNELLDHIFGLRWLEPRYRLRYRGKELHQLSPGEKGTILLIFYLLVDKNDQPLIIDQPEDNLDNQTVVRVLVDSIKQAREKRQVVLVTHNPNLAVLCDAEQVIACFMYLEQGNAVQYFPGAIENPTTNEHLINILEGTKPAFKKRGERYEAYQ